MGVSGKHNPDNVLLGLHVSPEVKALTMIVSDACGKTITETILDGLYATAHSLGIMVDGKVVDKYVADVRLRAEQVRAAKKERQKQ